METMLNEVMGRLSSGMTAWGAPLTHSLVKLLKIIFFFKKKDKPMEMILRANSKWINIYSKKSMTIQ